MSIDDLLEEIKVWLGEIIYSGFDNVSYKLFENGEQLSKKCNSFGITIIENQMVRVMNTIEVYKTGNGSKEEVGQQLGILSFSLETMMSN